MKIERRYKNTGIPVDSVRPAIDLLTGQGSSLIGEGWAHRLREWRLFHDDADITCDGKDEMLAAVAKRGNTIRFFVKYESSGGRLVSIDATDGTRIVVNVANGSRTIQLLDKVEQLLGLVPIPRRVFLSHGRSSLWTRVQTFIEKETHLNLEAIEFEQRPKGGRTIAQKLREESEQCSYAVIVATGDDFDDEGEPHMRDTSCTRSVFFRVATASIASACYGRTE